MPRKLFSAGGAIRKCVGQSFLLLVTLSLATTVYGNYIVGVAPFVRIDPATGDYSISSNIGNAYHALASDSLGNLYASTSFGSVENGRIIRIDRTTGMPLQIFNAVTPGAGGIRGLSFDKNDKLLGSAGK